MVAGLTLPYLVDQNIGAIAQWAAQNGIALQTSTDSSSTKAQGTIVSQSPAPGSTVAPGQTVRLQVSGTATEAIPNVQGQNCQQAQKTLIRAGLYVIEQQGASSGIVTRVSPTGQAPSGTTVTLRCGS